jgi:hypothetical protein
MALTGAPFAELVYILTDAPDFLIESEAKKYAWANNINYMESDLFAQFHRKMTFADVSPELKNKTYLIERNDQAISEIYKRVEQCRTYINSIKF